MNREGTRNASKKDKEGTVRNEKQIETEPKEEEREMWLSEEGGEGLYGQAQSVVARFRGRWGRG